MINLIEYGSEYLINKDLYTEEDRIYLSSLQKNDHYRFEVRECKEGLYFKPLNYVGSIKLSKERVNIYPRFDNGFENLLYMILFIKDIKFNIYKNILKVNSGLDNLYEYIVIMFIEEVKRIIDSGVAKEYVRINGNINVIKGRVDFNKHLAKNYFMGDKIYCNYDELESNILENQVILRAIKDAGRITLKSKVRRELYRYEEIFEKFCNEYKGNKIPNISYNRLNSYYESVHYFAKIIIEEIGFDDLYKEGSSDSRYSILIDMNHLFEAFVSKLCFKYFHKTHIVKSQFKIRNAILTKDEKRYRNIIPDIVLKDKRTDEYIIIDTKNKNYGSYNVNNEDIYQVAFYGMYFSDIFEASVKLVIVYPKYKEKDFSEKGVIISTLNKGKKTIEIDLLPIDINECLDKLKKNNKTNILIN